MASKASHEDIDPVAALSRISAYSGADLRERAGSFAEGDASSSSDEEAEGSTQSLLRSRMAVEMSWRQEQPGLDLPEAAAIEVPVLPEPPAPPTIADPVMQPMAMQPAPTVDKQSIPARRRKRRKPAVKPRRQPEQAAEPETVEPAPAVPPKERPRLQVKVKMPTVSIRSKIKRPDRPRVNAPEWPKMTAAMADQSNRAARKVADQSTRAARAVADQSGKAAKAVADAVVPAASATTAAASAATTATGKATKKAVQDVASAWAARNETDSSTLSLINGIDAFSGAADIDRLAELPAKARVSQRSLSYRGSVVKGWEGSAA